MGPSAIVSNTDSEPQERVSSPSTGCHIPSSLQHPSFIGLGKSRPSQVNRSSSPLAACGSLAGRRNLVLDIPGQCEFGSTGEALLAAVLQGAATNHWEATLIWRACSSYSSSSLCYVHPQRCLCLIAVLTSRCSLVITLCPRLNPRCTNSVRTSSHQGQPLQW